MSNKERKSYADFMAGMGSHTRAADDAAYIDGLVAEQPPEAPANLCVSDRLKLIRTQKGLSQKDVADRAGITAELVGQIEAELCNPPLGVLIKLAKALDLRMGTLISPAKPRPYSIVRSADRRAFKRHDERVAKKGYTFEHLAFEKGDRSMEPFIVTLSPSKESEELSTHDGQEFIFILEGQLEARLEDKVEILGPGDAIYYNSNVPHLVLCHGDKPTRILAVLHTEA